MPPKKRPKVEGTTSPMFAEIAEAIGIRTDQIFAKYQGDEYDDRLTFVLYTPNDDDSEEVWIVQLERDPKGIYRQAREAKLVPDFIENMRAHLDRAYLDRMDEK